MELNAQNSIFDTLKQVQSQNLAVEVFLRGGHSFTGKVAGLTERSVILGPLQGKEYFHAQVRMDDISALSVRTREDR